MKNTSLVWLNRFVEKFDTYCAKVAPNKLKGFAALLGDAHLSKIILGAVLLLAALEISFYWILGQALNPGETLAQTFHYRYGDNEFYAFFTRIFDANFGEISTYENFGTSVVPYPIVGFLPYAIFYQLFGVYGIILVDVIVNVIKLISLICLFGLFIRSKVINYLFSYTVLIAAGVTSPLSAFDFPFFETVNDYRLLRNYVSIVPFFFGLYLMMKIFANFDEKRPVKLDIYQASMLAVCMGSLFYGNVYAAFILFLGCFFVGLADLYKHLRIRLFWPVFLAVFFVCIVPYLFQRAYTPEYMFARWTHFQTRMFVLPDVSTRYLMLFALIYMASVVTKLLYKTGWAVPNEKGMDSEYSPTKYVFPDRYLQIFLIIALAALLSHPIFLVLTNTVIQPYHFDEEYEVILFFGLFILLAAGIRVVEDFSSLGNFKNYIFRPALFMLLYCVSGYVTYFPYKFHESQAHKTFQLRSWRDEGFPSQIGYRQDLAEAMATLGQDPYKECKVVGTFDYQLMNFWVAHHQGYAFIPDPSFSTVSNEELENRLLMFANLLSIPNEDFIALMKKRYFVIRFNQMGKYLASRYQTYSDITDYSPEEVRVIMSSYNTWSIIIPASELERMIEKRQSLPKEIPYRIDLIAIPKFVLKNTRYQIPDNYKPIISNNSFDIYGSCF